MADKAVSELVAASQVKPADLFVLEQDGTAKKLTGQILENWLLSFAEGHGGIQNIEKLSTNGLRDLYRITLSDTTVFDFIVMNGRSINNIAKTSSDGLVDTYTINYNSGDPDTFTVANGAKGDTGDAMYLWIKYASQEPTSASHSFGDIPDNWIGVYSGKSETAPADWTQYKWFQIKGKQGDVGAPATLISAEVHYQVSNLGTVAPSGEWSENVPAVSQGKYLWTRIVQTFNTGDPITAYTVSRMGIDGLGSVRSVCGVDADLEGNVPLTAADVDAAPADYVDFKGAVNTYAEFETLINNTFNAIKDNSEYRLFCAFSASDSAVPAGSWFVSIKREWEGYGVVEIVNDSYRFERRLYAGTWGDWRRSDAAAFDDVLNALLGVSE